MKEAARIFYGLNTLIDFCQTHDRKLETFANECRFSVWVVSDQNFDDDQKCVDELIAKMKRHGWEEDETVGVMFFVRTNALKEVDHAGIKSQVDELFSDFHVE